MMNTFLASGMQAFREMYMGRTPAGQSPTSLKSYFEQCSWGTMKVPDNPNQNMLYSGVRAKGGSGLETWACIRCLLQRDLGPWACSAMRRQSNLLAPVVLSSAITAPVFCHAFFVLYQCRWSTSMARMCATAQTPAPSCMKWRTRQSRI